MIEKIVLKIEDRKYGMYKMSPIRGASLGLRVMKLIAAALNVENSGEIFTQLKKDLKSVSESNLEANETEIATSNLSKIGFFLAKFLGNIDVVELDSLIQEIYKHDIYCEDLNLKDEVNFDMNFQKYPGDLYVVAVWAIYHNVKDFFTGIGGGMKAFTADFKKPEANKLK